MQQKAEVLSDGKQEDQKCQDLIYAMETGPAEKHPNNKGNIKLFGAYIG